MSVLRTAPMCWPLICAACGPVDPTSMIAETVRGDTTILSVPSAFQTPTLQVDSAQTLWRSAELGRPTAMVMLEGVLAVADQSQIHFVEVQGEEARTVGGAGEGPQEFGLIAKLGVFEDRLVAVDSRHRRLSWWWPDGEFIETTPASWSESYPNPATDSNPLGVAQGAGYFVASQLIRLEGFTGSALLQMSLEDGTVRDVVHWEGQEWTDFGQLMAPSKAFPAAPVVGISTAGRYAWGDGFDPCITMQDLGSGVLRICRDRPQVPVTGGVRRPPWSEVDLDPRFAEAIRTVVEEQEVGEFFPAYDQIRVAADGGLWVRLLGEDAPDLHPNLLGYADGYEPEVRRWEQYDAQGHPLAVVEVPNAFDPQVFLVDGAAGFLELNSGELVVARVWWAAS